MPKTTYEKIQALGLTPKPPTNHAIDISDIDNPKIAGERASDMPALLKQYVQAVVLGGRAYRIDISAPGQAEKAASRFVKDYEQRTGKEYYDNSAEVAETAAAIQRAKDITSSPATKQVAAEKAAQDEDNRRTRGRAATLLTGSQGLLSQPNISRRRLMGF